MASLDEKSDAGTYQPTWVLTAGETGQAVRVAPYADKSYAIWGSMGGYVKIEGSWDKSASPASDSWFVLTETDNTTAINLNAAAAGAILENPIWIRARALASVDKAIVALNCTKGGK